ncbi:hypothetical protein D9M68_127700 [compost metagenome]
MTQQAISPPFTRNSKIASFIARAMTGLGILLGAMWALITYVVPDPSVFGFSFINWRNVVLLVSTFTFLGAVSLAWQIRNLPTMLRGTLQFLLISGLSLIFFILGTEYAKPSFEFAKVQSRIVENEGANLLGKRMEVLDNVRLELVGCENIGRLPTCIVELTNLDVDRDFRFDNSTRLFDESGGPLSLKTIRVGQVEDSYWMQFQLIRNVPTRVTLIFQQTSDKLGRTPAIRLMFRDKDGESQVLKFSDVPMQ